MGLGLGSAVVWSVGVVLHCPIDLPLGDLGALWVEGVLLGERDAVRRAQRVHELSHELRRSCLGLGVGVGARVRVRGRGVRVHGYGYG